MGKVIALLLALLWMMGPIASPARADSLQIVTINVWHGLGGRAFFKLTEYESAETREARYQSLLTMLRRIRPDIVALQEANPTPAYARRIALDMGYDEIHQVANAGIKLFGWGIPTNIREGLVILARKELALERAGACRLSGPRGAYHSDRFSFQLGETRYALAGKVAVQGTPLYLFDVHLHDGFCNDRAYFDELDALKESGQVSGQEYQEKLMEMQKDIARRKREIAALISFVNQVTQGEHPAILLGDFNATEASEEIVFIREEGGYLDAFRAADPQNPGYTWHAAANPNAQRGKSPAGEANGLERFDALCDAMPRRIDYIFLSDRFFAVEDILNSRVLSNPGDDGIYPSDHFGVLVEVNLE